MNDLIYRIRSILNDLPRAERAFAEAAIENPSTINELTLARLAFATGTSEASIVRFCKRLGFSGINDFKEALYNSVDGENEGNNHLFRDNNTAEIIKKVYESNISILNDTLALASDNYDRAVTAMLNASSINFFGVGDAFITCMFAKYKFSKLGKICTAEGDAFQQYVTAQNLGLKDVAVAISYDGSTKTVCDCLRIARSNKATTIAITRKHPSFLLRYTEIPLYSAINDLSKGGEKAARRVSDQFIIDVLYYSFINRMGYDNYSEQISNIGRAVNMLQIEKEKNKNNKL